MAVVSDGTSCTCSQCDAANGYFLSNSNTSCSKCLPSHIGQHCPLTPVVGSGSTVADCSVLSVGGGNTCFCSTCDTANNFYTTDSGASCTRCLPLFCFAAFLPCIDSHIAGSATKIANCSQFAVGSGTSCSCATCDTGNKYFTTDAGASCSKCLSHVRLLVCTNVID